MPRAALKLPCLLNIVKGLINFTNGSLREIFCGN